MLGEALPADVRSLVSGRAPPQEDVLEVVPIEPSRVRPRRHRFECPECGSTGPPIIRSQISQAGWIVFVVLLLFFFPLCFLGLLMKEEYRVCTDCGARLGTTRQWFG